MQYWKTYQKDLILGKLNAVVKKNNSVVIWQQFGSQRFKYPAELFYATRSLCKIKIIGDFDRFNPEYPFFTHVPGLEIIFKKDKYSKMANFIEFGMPNDIQLYERRKTKRYYYKYQDHKVITYYSESIDPATKNPDFTFSSVLVDISISGAGMVVGSDQLRKLSPGIEFFLINLTDQKLPDPFRVKITYIEPYKNKEKGLYKVGLIFADELDSISYKSISSIVEIKQRKSAGLTPDQYCGLDFEEQVRVLNTIESTNPVLSTNIKDNMAYLDKLRYMTTHMKVEFLKEVNHDLLAVALRLSSKELIYDLLSELTKTMQEEFLEKLQDGKPASAVCKAQDKILISIREMEQNGTILLDPTAFITYV